MSDDKIDAILFKLRQIDPYDFEHFIADLWSRQGWQTRVTEKSNDRGLDVIAEKNSPVFSRQAIQAKLNAEDNNVSRPEIQQYNSLKNQEPKPDVVIIITTSNFTREAKKEAENLNVKLISGKELIGIISETNSSDLLKKYTESSRKNLTYSQNRKSGAGELTDKLKKLRKESDKEWDTLEYGSYDSDIIGIFVNTPEGINTKFDNYMITYTNLFKSLEGLGARDRFGSSDMPKPVKNIHIFRYKDNSNSFDERTKVKIAASDCGFVVLENQDEMLVIGEPADEIPSISEIVEFSEKTLMGLYNLNLDDVDFIMAGK